MKPVTDTTHEVDGRRARRDQNRLAVLDALVALFREGHYAPGTAEIAQRAGISPRSLFRYFDDADDLNRAAIERILERAQPLVAVDASPDQPTAEKVERLVAARQRLFEEIRPAARAARIVAHRQPVVEARVDATRTDLRNQFRRLFAPELDALGRERARHVLAAADVLCSFEADDLLRHDQRLSAPRAGAALAHALSILLAAGPGVES
jgi:AcrR family transcriptional regulator